MTILSDASIEKAIASGDLIINNLADAAIQPASIDIRLGQSFRRMCAYPWGLDLGQTDEFVYEPEQRVYANGTFQIDPGQFVLGTTIEWIRVAPTMACRLEGKSSLARVGLGVHVTGGWIDPGFEGEITLELANLGPRPLLLRPGMFIGQLAFMLLDHPADRPYGHRDRRNRYQGQAGATPSRYRADGAQP